MARDPRFEVLYETFRKFLQQCILDDRSLLWPSETPWMPANVADIKRRLVESPMFGDGLSFGEKLQRQMEGATSEQWMIICDIYYIYFLPSSFITFDKKIGDIEWAASQGGLTPPGEDNDTWEAQSHGFTRTTLQYHYKYAQFWLILLFADYVKRAEDPESIVSDASRMQQVLDQLLEGISSKNDRAYDMRHAMLYLAFPEQYERIISTRDKERIIETYGDQLEGPVPDDRDEALRRVRQLLSDRFEELNRPFDFYDELKHEWRPEEPEPDCGDEDGEKPPTEDRDVLVVRSVLERTRNVILYGPPGGGKTYVANKVAEALVDPQTEQPLPESAVRQRVVEDLATYEVLALSLRELGPGESRSVSEILEHPLVEARFRAGPVKQPRQNVWGHLQWHTSPESKTVSVAERRMPYLFDKDDRSRWYVTEGGREYVDENLSSQIASLNSMVITQSIDDFVERTTFHQSYAYEDFVEGLRPVKSEEDPGDISYDVVPGVFRGVCTRAADDPHNKYVLVIDEINRGNIAKILGELITLLEDDKRAGGDNPLKVTLPYSGDEFEVPSNVYVIGTMNTADRSIALLDVALRRRFAFVELMPRPQLLRGIHVESAETVVPLEPLLRSLNKSIRQYLDRDHQVGHSYLLEVARADDAERADVLEFVWNNRIVPLLEEYFYSQRDRMAEVLSPFRTDVESDREQDEEEELDSSFARLTGDDLMTALAKLAETGATG